MLAMKKRYGWATGEQGHNLCGEHGRPLNNYKILTLFGLPPTSPIPPDFSDKKLIGDTMVYIRTQEQARNSRLKRRTVARCNKCGMLVCAGHLMQHVRSHKD
jgi:hypothetical protein